MAYRLENFLVNVSSSDNRLHLRDSNGVVRWSIDAFDIVSSIVSNNLLKIRLKSTDDTIIIDFTNKIDAKNALGLFQTQVESILVKTPILVDPKIVNYVDGLFNQDLFLNGDLIPGTNSVYSLGSPDYQWHSLYASSSVYIGGVTLSTVGDSIYVDNLTVGGDIVSEEGYSLLSFFAATSSTPLQVPNVGQNVVVSVPPGMSWTPMQNLIAYASLYNNYMVDDYVEEDTSAYFVASVDSYDRNTGTLSLVVDYSNGYGVTISGTTINVVPTYSLWYLNLTGKTGQEGADGIGTGSTVSDITLLGTTVFQQTVEVLGLTGYVPGASPSTVVYDFSQSGIWYHNDLTQDYLASFINVPETDNRVITCTIVISQTSSAYIPNQVTINHSGLLPILWGNGVQPSGSPNQTDLIGFSFIRANGSVSVLGQLSTYASV